MFPAVAPPEPVEFGEYLGDLLAARSWPAGALAARVNVDPSLVRKWTTGARTPDTEFLPEIATALRCSPAEERLLELSLKHSLLARSLGKHGITMREALALLSGNWLAEMALPTAPGPPTLMSRAPAQQPASWGGDAGPLRQPQSAPPPPPRLPSPARWGRERLIAATVRATAATAAEVADRLAPRLKRLKPAKREQLSRALLELRAEWELVRLAV